MYSSIHRPAPEILVLTKKGTPWDQVWHLLCLQLASYQFKLACMNPICFCRAFRQGMHDLKVWPNVEADPSSQSTTPGKTKDSNDQMSRLAKVRTLVINTPYWTLSTCLKWFNTSIYTLGLAPDWKSFLLFLNQSICCGYSKEPSEWEYGVGTQKNHLNEMVLLSTQNTCLSLWIRKKWQ